MKTIIFLAALLSCLSVNAQFEYGEFNGKTKKGKKNYEPPKDSEEISWKIKNQGDSLNYELYYMRYYLGKYSEQRIKSRRVMVTGAVISIASIVFSPQSSNLSIAGTSLGGTIFAIGGLMNWSAGKWLRSATIKPTNYGISLEVPF